MCICKQVLCMYMAVCKCLCVFYPELTADGNVDKVNLSGIGFLPKSDVKRGRIFRSFTGHVCTGLLNHTPVHFMPVRFMHDWGKLTHLNYSEFCESELVCKNTVCVFISFRLSVHAISCEWHVLCMCVCI